MVQVYRCGTTACVPGTNMPSSERPMRGFSRAWGPTPVATSASGMARQGAGEACPQAPRHRSNAATPHAGWNASLPACVNATEPGEQAPSCTLSPVGPATYSANKYTSQVGALPCWVVRALGLPLARLRPSGGCWSVSGMAGPLRGRVAACRTPPQCMPDG